MNRELSEEKNNHADYTETQYRLFRDANRHIAEIIAIFHSLLILQCWLTKYVRTFEHQHECSWLHWRRQYSDIWKIHEEKLQNARMSSRKIRAVNASTCSRVCVCKVWVDSFNQKFQEIQYESLHKDRQSKHRLKNEHTSTETANWHQIEMRITRQKDSR